MNETQDADVSAIPDLLASPKFWLVCLLALHILVLLHAAQWYSYAVFAGNSPRPFLYLRWSMELWYSRAAIAPLALWLARRRPFDLQHWLRSLAVYAASSLVLAVLGSVLQSAVVNVLEVQRQSFRARNYFDGRPPRLTPLNSFEKAVVEGWPHLVYNMFTCWMLMGLVQGMYYYRHARQRELQASRLQTQLARMRLEALRMQLNPHFLFNTLHAISTLIYEEPHAAEEMLLRLSHLLRSLLDDESEPEISLRRELNLLECQLGIEQVRFGDRLTTRIEVEAGLLDCAVPQLILQPLVENAIRHGIGRRLGTDAVEIIASSADSLLLLEVRNRSSQLETSPEESLQRGIGLTNTRLRLKALYSDRSSLSLRNLSPCGVAVSITFPLRKLARLESVSEMIV